MVLEKIQKTGDVRSLDKKELQDLADEIREFLIDNISRNGGHLGSNLGVVELTIALHLVFDPATDRIIWDVGHQCYTHKILTGRKDGFENLRKFGGMSGFPKRGESECDSFDTGHSSTSISAGLGYVAARDLSGEDYSVISVIGDGALTGGMAYEALNNAARLHTNFIIVLNDNEMSIAENVGGLSSYLSSVRTAEPYLEIKSGVEDALNKIPVYGTRMIASIRNTKNGIKQIFVPGMLFENLGIKYLGPVDGHNISKMTKIFREARKVPGPVVVHVNTIKGKGYGPALRNPSRFHGAEPFDVETGVPKNRHQASYANVFSTVMCKLGKTEPKLCAVTAAMPDGTGLKRFRNMYPDRFFDVGIAEEHAVTFAAGLALGGMIPVVAVYSSFLQRAYDQMIHDVCMQKLHVVFALDRAGLVGSDGETHHGTYDLSYLSSIPGMAVLAPKNKWELADMLRWAVEQHDGPAAIRYPRGEACDLFRSLRAPIVYGKSEILYDEKEIALIFVGSMLETAVKVREYLRDIGYSCSLINARFVHPLDEEMLLRTVKDHRLIVTIEENVRSGGFGDHVLEFVNDIGCGTRVINAALPDEFIGHGSVEILRKECLLDPESICRRIVAEYAGMEQDE